MTHAGHFPNRSAELSLQKMHRWNQNTVNDVFYVSVWLRCISEVACEIVWEPLKGTEPVINYTCISHLKTSQNASCEKGLLLSARMWLQPSVELAPVIGNITICRMTPHIPGSLSSSAMCFSYLESVEANQLNSVFVHFTLSCHLLCRYLLLFCYRKGALCWCMVCLALK